LIDIVKKGKSPALNCPSPSVNATEYDKHMNMTLRGMLSDK